MQSARMQRVVDMPNMTHTDQPLTANETVAERNFRLNIEANAY